VTDETKLEGILEMLVKITDRLDNRLEKLSVTTQASVNRITVLENSLQTMERGFEKVVEQIGSMNSKLEKLISEGMAVKGGWWTMVHLGSIIVATVAIAKAFGII
jgi:hypothetical protein